MREHLKEGDLIMAEVQKVREDGYLNLHTRSLKYGKLGPGVLIIVSPSLIRRRKNHVRNYIILKWNRESPFRFIIYRVG